MYFVLLTHDMSEHLRQNIYLTSESQIFGLKSTMIKCELEKRKCFSIFNRSSTVVPRRPSLNYLFYLYERVRIAT